MRPSTSPASDTACEVVWRLRGRFEGREQTFSLTPGDHRVGSSPRSDLRLVSPGVSREHALIKVTDQGIAVLDCGSKNGTFIDCRRVERATLARGSVISFGPVELMVEDLDQEDLELAIAFDPAGSETWDGESIFSHDTLSCDPAASVGLQLEFPTHHVPGASPAMTALYRQMETAARGDQPVLIIGETGVGKEGLVAILHGSSARREGPLVTLNCAAIPADLFEAELFGIGRGVATGVEARLGKVRQAHGGTLFLDEIGDMPLPLQTKLLRVLQENEIQPLGGKAETVDIRVVAATNADLENRMVAGEFRRDLYFRLAGAILEAPPLRRRRADIPALVEHFLRRFSREARVRLRGVTVKAMGLWLAHDWPGNVRELEHEVRRAVSNTADRGVIDTSKISIGLRREGQGIEELNPERGEGSNAVPSPHLQEVGGDVGKDEDLHLETRLQSLEKKLVCEALRRTRGRQNHAAELLGISRNGLARRLERLGIDYRTFR